MSVFKDASTHSPDRLRSWLLAAAMALWVARPLFPSESAAAHGDGMTVVMLWALLTVAWLAGAAARPRFRLRFGWTDAAALLLVGLHSLAALRAVWQESPRPALNMLWEWIGMGLAYFSRVNCSIRSDKPGRLSP